MRLQGLDGARFLDNTDSNKEKTQLGDVTIASQTDNAFLSTQNAVDLLDPKMRRRIRLQKANSSTTVVWNPWQEGASGLRDLGEGEWKQFLCVEASNIIRRRGHAGARAGTHNVRGAERGEALNEMKAAQRYLLETLNRIRS